MSQVEKVAVVRDTYIRYGASERANHWIVVICALALMLSGLAFFHPAFFWLTNLFGGGQSARAIHPWIGVVLAFAFTFMGVRFFHQNIWTRDDTEWMKHVGDVISHREEPGARGRPLQRGAEDRLLRHVLVGHHPVPVGPRPVAALFRRPRADLAGPPGRSAARPDGGGHDHHHDRARLRRHLERRFRARHDPRPGYRRLAVEASPQVAAQPGRLGTAMIVTAEQFGPGQGPGVAPAPGRFVRPDAAALFARRAARLRSLADGHPMADFLVFVAGLAQVQHELAGIGGTWQDLLPQVLNRALGIPAPPAAGVAITSLLGESSAAIAARADRWLAGTPLPEDLAGAAFVTAALQLARAHAAAAAPAQAVGHGLCPLCGGAPVAATLSTRGEVSGLRHLHCGLCGTAWHLERLRCPRCDSEGKAAFHHLDGYQPDVKAESCGACGTYLKLFDTDKWPDVEPLADDLACAEPGPADGRARLAPAVAQSLPARGLSPC
ncbi:MAG: formate dehydrogenase accessory protein FdhE [Magnetospirillum sp.]|nr:formate dehydrogenase accessory protein FdhE [Magnetospirillum sp.]